MTETESNQDNHMKIIGIEQRWRGSHLSAFSAKVNHGDKNFDWEFFSRSTSVLDYNVSKPDAVTVVPIRITDHGKKSLVIINQFRAPIGRTIWELPAGLIDAGETAETAGVRELREETGLKTRNVFGVSSQMFHSPGCTDESCKILFLECFGNSSKENQMDDEDICVRYLSVVDMEGFLFGKPVNTMGMKVWSICSEIYRRHKQGLDPWDLGWEFM